MDFILGLLGKNEILILGSSRYRTQTESQAPHSPSTAVYNSEQSAVIRYVLYVII